jgi:CHASE2 domain-containing sensor protein
MIKTVWHKLKEKGLRYWTTAAIVFVLSFVGTPYVYDYLDLTAPRAEYFQWLLDLTPRLTTPRYVKIVLIDDDEYWLGEPAGRRPIKRDYLAAIVDKLRHAEVNVIALDIDARLPNPESMAVPDEYRQETTTLIDAITAAAQHDIKVVLSTPLWFDDAGEYITDSDIYQAFGLCRPHRDGDEAAQPKMGTPRNYATPDNVSCAYISLPDDPLAVPLQIRMADGSSLDSFGLAVARAVNPDNVDDFLKRVGDKPRYSNFISSEKFAAAKSTLSAHQLLTSDVKDLHLRGGAVIVGGHWSAFAAGRGEPVDEHWTPVGSTVGAELHANFVEDILDDRTFSISPEWFVRATEVALGIAAAFAFALIPPLWGKLLGAFAVLVFMLLIQFVVLIFFGVFFDAFVPIVALGLHALYDRLAGEEPHH